MTSTETIAEAWRRRTTQVGAVDFTMMYVAHDAFSRDLGRLRRAGRDGRLDTPEARATWAMFRRQLHIHHQLEDAQLWPQLRTVVSDWDDVAVLDAMVAEHDTLDPQLDRVESVLTTADAGAALTELATALGTHMRHEEEAALPLVARHLGTPGWEAFRTAARKSQGSVRAAAQYLTWVLDDALPPARDAVLGVLPPPARLVFRWILAPAYRHARHLH